MFIRQGLTLIYNQVAQLQTMPMLGVALPNKTLPNLRKLTIPYGKAGYVLLYSFVEENNEIIIETLRHMKELEPEFIQF